MIKAAEISNEDSNDQLSQLITYSPTSAAFSTAEF